jgi:drug/metabolite transporter (DMT)-like permease
MRWPCSTVSARRTTTSWGLCWRWRQSRPGPGTRYAIPVGLRQRPALASGTWAIAQGLATLPLAAVGMALPVFSFDSRGSFDYPLGPYPLRYVGLMLTLGLCASWLGTLLWNRASKLLPTALVGQLIVFETLAAFAYAFIWRGALPGSTALLGIALLVGGVILGVRAFRAG